MARCCSHIPGEVYTPHGTGNRLFSRMAVLLGWHAEPHRAYTSPRSPRCGGKEGGV
ncbi:hypothetical protein BJY04DRAFT_203304 [Aspergillus karnatakaensis]|uniref:uncharacterized protein n=1 Tax=Aspergillus karnatakaensis TaxID=1810916 RepID=UPI003CCDCD58